MKASEWVVGGDHLYPYIPCSYLQVPNSLLAILLAILLAYSLSLKIPDIDIRYFLFILPLLSFILFSLLLYINI